VRPGGQRLAGGVIERNGVVVEVVGAVSPGDQTRNQSPVPARHRVPLACLTASASNRKQTAVAWRVMLRFVSRKDPRCPHPRMVTCLGWRGAGEAING
jgi:hypothetical protein